MRIIQLNGIYSVKEAADILGVCVEVMRRRIRSGAVGCVRDGTWLRVTGVQLQTYIDAHTTQPASITGVPS